MLKKKLFHCEGGEALGQLSHRGYESSILGNIQNLTGRGAWHPAVADPALSWRVELHKHLLFVIVFIKKQKTWVTAVPVLLKGNMGIFTRFILLLYGEDVDLSSQLMQHNFVHTYCD